MLSYNMINIFHKPALCVKQKKKERKTGDNTSDTMIKLSTIVYHQMRKEESSTC